ncbi:MAG: Flp family type IVb pilin [Terracidiphilus sp.]
MNNTLIKLYVMFQDLMNREEGQDLVEYALVLFLISIAAVATLGAMATAVTNIFQSIATKLA